MIFKKELKEGVHPIDIKKVNNEWLITGNSGIALLVTGTGVTMKEAQKTMQNRIGNIMVNNSYYRTDIGNRWTEDSDKLWAWEMM